MGHCILVLILLLSGVYDITESDRTFVGITKRLTDTFILKFTKSTDFTKCKVTQEAQKGTQE